MNRMKLLAAGQGHGVLPGQLDALLVRARDADEALVRGLAEGQAELGEGHGAHHGLVHVLHGLDEMRLAEDEVQGIGVLDGDGLQFHIWSSW